MPRELGVVTPMMTININGCSACGSHHAGLNRLEYRLCQSEAGCWPTINGHPVRWFAMCPVTDIPILIAESESKEVLPSPAAPQSPSN